MKTRKEMAEMGFSKEHIDTMEESFEIEALEQHWREFIDDSTLVKCAALYDMCRALISNFRIEHHKPTLHPEEEDMIVYRFELNGHVYATGIGVSSLTTDKLIFKDAASYGFMRAALYNVKEVFEGRS